MNIFSEIYGAYFRTAAALLSRHGGITEADVNEAVRRFGFRDSALFLPKKLLPQADGSDWGLLRKTGGGYEPVTENPPPDIFTTLQKRWLKAKLLDPRISLFLGDGEIARLSERLSEVKPLYRPEDLRFFDRFSDGDDYKDPVYRENFRTVLLAIKRRQALKTDYLSGHGKRVITFVLPLKLEYSAKNDKFRVFCRRIVNGILRGGVTMNVARMRSVEPVARHFSKTAVSAEAMSRFFSGRRAAEPVKVYVRPERNAVERFLMEFASYEKRTERDPETGGITAEIFFDRYDETELLIQLLSFGAAVEIISPSEFRAQAAERVKKQAELISKQDFFG